MNRRKTVEKMWIKWNPNPVRSDPVGDCTVRALAKALDISWEEAHVLLDYNSYMMGDISNSNVVLGSVLRQHGFVRDVVPNSCPDCYTANDFAMDHPTGTYVLGFGTHVATVVDGNLYDTWNSLNEIPIYYWYRKDD